MVALIPSLRVPVQVNLPDVLTNWLDAVNQGFLSSSDGRDNLPEFTSTECQQDFQKLHLLRSKIGDLIDASSRDDNPHEDLEPLLQEYYSCLKEFEERGFPSSSGLPAKLKWKSAVSGVMSGHKGLLWERCSVLWNLASLEASKGSRQDNSKKGWVQANKCYQMAFSYMNHLNELLEKTTPYATATAFDHNDNSDADFQSFIVSFWEHTLSAKAQMAAYEKSASMNRPRQMLLAKLAQGAVSLWEKAENSMTLLQQHERQLSISDSSAQQHHSIKQWALLAQAWSQYTRCLAEHHESIVHQEKDQQGELFARLELSLQHGNCCLDLVNTGELLEDQFQYKLPQLLEEIRETYNALLASGTAVNDGIDLREIRPELVSKGRSNLPSAMESGTHRLFANLIGPAGRKAIDEFKKAVDKSVSEMSDLAKKKSTEAREELARINLPHSLVAYEQEQSGGGIPPNLWQRVDKIQKSNCISMLKRDLWNLRDMAEEAQRVFTKTKKELQEDVDMDSLFRQQHPDYKGTDVQQIQVSFRQALSTYESLLQKSQEGDSLLLTRLEKLDQDPKFKLLQFSKSQLDRLLPGNHGGNEDPYKKQAPAAMFDTAPLKRVVVELSNLLDERETTMRDVHQAVRDYDIKSSISGIKPDSPSAAEEYEAAVKLAHKKAVSPLEYELRVNISEQNRLVAKIMQQNDRFVAARGQRNNDNPGSNSAPSGSCIAMIEEALDEIETLTKHLTEGKHFYNVVIPKLEQLKQQVSNASARLTADRCEYAESYSAKRRQQEKEDELMAKRIAEENGSNSIPHTSNNDLPSQQNGVLTQNGEQQNNNNPHSQPGVYPVDHTEPQVRVDDDKVASLIAMDFDPDKVVRALVKYDNNFDAALNELIS